MGLPPIMQVSILCRKLEMKHIAVIEQTGNGYGAYLPDLPGRIAAGDTLEETEQSIR